MRVVLVVPAFPRLSETFIAAKFEALLSAGRDVWVVCGSSHDRDWKWFPRLSSSHRARERVVQTWPSKPRRRVFFLLPLLLAWCLVRSPHRTSRYLLRGGSLFGLGVLKPFYLDARLLLLGPDIIHFEFGALAVGRMYLRDLLNCRIIVSFRGHDLNFVGIDQPNFYEEVWAGADEIHVLGDYLWRKAQERGCSLDRPHTLIPPAVDVERFNPADHFSDAVATGETPLRLLSVARLHWSKGFEHLLTAVNLLSASGLPLELRIVGDGPYLDAVAFCKHELGLDHCVSLLGAVPHETVVAQMRWADVFVHAAVEEGFCNAVIEAQAMALPVVCSDAGGLPENVENEVSGFVVPRRDSTALAGRIATLAADPSLRRRMGLSGRRRVMSRFRIEDQITAIERMYRDVHGARSGEAERAPDRNSGTPIGELRRL